MGQKNQQNRLKRLLDVYRAKAPAKEFDKEKLKTLIHHICFNFSTNQGLGSVKLNKIFWFADKHWMQEHGETITTLPYYIRRQRGPMLPNFYELIDELEKEGRISQHIADGVFRQHLYQCSEKPDYKDIPAEQLQVMDDFSEAIIKRYTADEISELSHGYLWELFDNNERIPTSILIGDDAEITRI